MTEDPNVDPPGGSSARASSVETLIVEEHGQWVVYIVVLFSDCVVRSRVDVYPTRRRADISARLIKRGAEREIGGPRNG